MSKTGLEIPSALTDDNEFIDAVNLIVNALVRCEAPAVVWVIRVDNWFDHKWLRFSGHGTTARYRTVGAINPRDTITEQFCDTVKVEFSQDNLTFPPFTPERITDQWSFRRSDSGYVEDSLPKLPHRTERQWSHLNLQRRVEEHGKSNLFVWFSGNTLKNGRGSMMVYSVQSRNPDCWYAGFGRSDRWIAQRTKGINREDVLRLMARG